MSMAPAPLDESFIAPPKDPNKKIIKLAIAGKWRCINGSFDVRDSQSSDTGYFLYVDGQHINESGMIDSENLSQAWMRFKTAIIPFVRG